VHLLQGAQLGPTVQIILPISWSFAHEPHHGRPAAQEHTVTPAPPDATRATTAHCHIKHVQREQHRATDLPLPISETATQGKEQKTAPGLRWQSHAVGQHGSIQHSSTKPCTTMWHTLLRHVWRAGTAIHLPTGIAAHPQQNLYCCLCTVHVSVAGANGTAATD
jgi:hypothetical protein